MKKSKVLFVCVGNACRSQMAEAFARTYGGDTLEAMSAGLAPAMDIPEMTRKVMLEKGIGLEGHFPKGLLQTKLDGVDVVVNISGAPLGGLRVPAVREWKVRDPIGGKEKLYQQVRDEIESLVVGLVLDLRRRAQAGN